MGGTLRNGVVCSLHVSSMLFCQWLVPCSSGSIPWKATPCKAGTATPTSTID